jgi:hypothetical protein
MLCSFNTEDLGFSGAGDTLRASHMLGKCSLTNLYSHLVIFFGLFDVVFLGRLALGDV